MIADLHFDPPDPETVAQLRAHVLLDPGTLDLIHASIGIVPSCAPSAGVVSTTCESRPT